MTLKTLLIGFGLLVAAIAATSFLFRSKTKDPKEIHFKTIPQSAQMPKNSPATLNSADVDKKVRDILEKLPAIRRETVRLTDWAAQLQTLQIALDDLQRKRDQGMPYPEYSLQRAELEHRFEMVLQKAHNEIAED